MGTLRLDPGDLNAYGDKLGDKIREAISEQYPEHTVQPKERSERILLDPNVVPPPVRIDWMTEVHRNEGFTIIHALIWAIVVLLAIPAVTFFVIYESIAPGVGVTMLAAVIAFLVGKAREKRRN